MTSTAYYPTIKWYYYNATGAAADKAWYAAAMSSDGSKMLAGADGGRLYLGYYPLDGTLRWTELTGGMQMLSGGMRG